MPKMFRFFTIIVFSSACAYTHAQHSLCMPQAPSQAETSTQTPDNQAYFDAMSEAQKSASTLDWVTDSTRRCGGYYQTPNNPNPQTNIPSDQASSYFSADYFEQSEKGDLLLSGNVHLYQGNRRLSCDSLRANTETQSLSVTGNVMLREGDLLLLADSAEFDKTKENARLKNSQYAISELGLRGKAGDVELNNKKDDTGVVLKDASFTFCPPTKEDWLISSSELDLDTTKGWGKAWHTTFKIKNVPVFYLPYFNFPLDDRRKTGVLWPAITVNNDGVDIALPIYFNLAPNYDLTYQARYYQKHGYQHGLEARYKNRWSNWSVGGAWIGDDQSVNTAVQQNAPDVDNERWLGFIKESGSFDQYWSSFIDYQSVSDSQYLRDWGTQGLDVQNTLNIKRTAGIVFDSPDWLLHTQVVDYQRLDLDAVTKEPLPEYYQLLPQIIGAYQGLEKPFRINPVFWNQYTAFAHDDNPEAQRLYNRTGVSLPLYWQAFTSKATAQAHNLIYQYSGNNELTDTNAQGDALRGNKSINAGSFSLDNQLHLERQGSHSKQTLTPRLFYTFTEQKDQSDLVNFDTNEDTFSYQQLYRSQRFSGFDRISDANRVTIGLENTWLNHNSTPLLQWGVGQIHYLADRQTTLFSHDRQQISINSADSKTTKANKQAINRRIHKTYFRDASDIAMQVQLFQGNNNYYSEVIYDPYDNALSSLAAHYQWQQREQIFNIGYRYDRSLIINSSTGYQAQTNVNQLQSSFHSKLNEQWGLFAKAHYDIENTQAVEYLAGFTYNSCCWAISLAWQKERRYLGDNANTRKRSDYNNRWFLQFEFTGLGSVTNSIGKLLNESIEGFRIRDDK